MPRVKIIRRHDRGGYYVMRWMEAGKVRQRSCRTRDRARAEHLCVRMEQELNAQEHQHDHIAVVGDT